MNTRLTSCTSCDTNSLLASLAIYLRDNDATSLASFGVGTGKGGLILFYCHYAALTGDATYYDRALQMVEQALNSLSPQTYKSVFGSNYYHELAEFGGLLCYLLENGHLDWNGEHLLHKIDGILGDRLQHHVAAKNLERLNGAIGVGFYFVRRAKANRSGNARQVLSKLLIAIQALRKGTEQTGYYWLCYAFAEPRAYTGSSHGSAMVINFLVALHKISIQPQTCTQLLHYATKWVLANQMDPGQYISSFPLWQGNVTVTNNLNLIYGDLSTTQALLHAAAVVGDKGHYDEALRIALMTINRRTVELTHLFDASVYYGISGTYLLYDAIYQQTQRQEFAIAARYWLGQIPGMAVHENDYMNFQAYFHHNFPAAQLGFGYGVVGIGLTLIQAQSNGQFALNEFIALA